MYVYIYISTHAPALSSRDAVQAHPPVSSGNASVYILRMYRRGLYTPVVWRGRGPGYPTGVPWWYPRTCAGWVVGGLGVGGVRRLRGRNPQWGCAEAGCARRGEMERWWLCDAVDAGAGLAVVARCLFVGLTSGQPGWDGGGAQHARRAWEALAVAIESETFVQSAASRALGSRGRLIYDLLMIFCLLIIVDYDDR